MPSSSAHELDPMQSRPAFPFHPIEELDADSRELLDLLRYELGATTSRMVIAGRYVLDAQIGGGSSGIVYRAQDKRSANQIVAIKVLRPQARAGGDHEAALHVQATRGGRAAHIASLREVGESEGQTFLVMDHIAGSNLRHWQRAQKRMLPDLLRTYLGAARGLSMVHSNGVVHGDFKPENVLVDGEGIAYLVDFGLATAVRNRGTIAAKLVGTRRYMAPELLAGAPPTQASDQYSFCVALFEALFERHPFLPAESSEATEGASAHANVNRESEAATDNPGRGLQLLGNNLAEVVIPALQGVPKRLRDVLRRGLAPDPAARNTNMDVVTAALAAIVTPAPASQLRRWLTVAVALIPLIVATPYTYNWWLERTTSHNTIDYIQVSLTERYFEIADRLESAYRYSQAIPFAELARSSAETNRDRKGLGRATVQLARLYFLDYRNPRLTEELLAQAATRVEPAGRADIYLLGVKNAAQRLRDPELAVRYFHALSEALGTHPSPRQELLAADARAITLNASNQRNDALRVSRNLVQDLEGSARAQLAPDERFTIEVNHASFLAVGGATLANIVEARESLGKANAELSPDSPRQADRLRVAASLATLTDDLTSANQLRMSALSVLERAFPETTADPAYCTFAVDIFLEQSEAYWRADDYPNASDTAKWAQQCSASFGSDKLELQVRAQQAFVRAREDSPDYEEARRTLALRLQDAERLPPQQALSPGFEVDTRVLLATSAYKLLWTAPEKLPSLAAEALDQLATAERIATRSEFPQRPEKLAEIAWYRGLVLMKQRRWSEAIASIKLARDSWPGTPPEGLLESQVLANDKTDFSEPPI